MSRPLIELLKREIHELTGYLIERSLVDSQHYPARRRRAQDIEVLQSDYWESDSWEGERRLQPRHLDYSSYHARLTTAGAYDLRFLDGALVQFQYEFVASSGELRRSRVAFLPSGDLTPFQEDSELYLADEPYGHVVDRGVVTVPLRFDFDSRPEVVQELHHPKSHLTIGQYSMCRLAASCAITPYHFIEMVLRCFYRTKDHLDTPSLPGPFTTMDRTITDVEEALCHIGLPTSGVRSV